MRLDAAASSCLRSALAGPARPANWLGVTPAALYLRTAGPPGAVALLAHGAVRLPCALLLSTTAAELPLTAIADAAGSLPVVGDNCLAWTGPAGPIVVRAVREWAPARVRPGAVAADALAALANTLPAPAALGIDGGLLTLLAIDPAAATAGLLGRGPGLTPAGDDVLAGFLLGAGAFGLDGTRVLAVIEVLAPARTTSLSAALLRHAARGECISEVSAFVADPAGPALSRLLAIGHTSGAALATGLAMAARAAMDVGEAGEAA